VFAAICCGDFTNEEPISPPIASSAAPPATQKRRRRRRASRDPRAACRPWSLDSLSVAGEPSCVTRSSMWFACHQDFEDSGRPLSQARLTSCRAPLRPMRDLYVSLMSTSATSGVSKPVARLVYRVPACISR
jgi:hypothetical protein